MTPKEWPLCQFVALKVEFVDMVRGWRGVNICLDTILGDTDLEPNWETARPQTKTGKRNGEELKEKRTARNSFLYAEYMRSRWWYRPKVQWAHSSFSFPLGVNKLSRPNNGQEENRKVVHAHLFITTSELNVLFSSKLFNKHRHIIQGCHLCISDILQYFERVLHLSIKYIYKKPLLPMYQTIHGQINLPTCGFFKA